MIGFAIFDLQFAIETPIANRNSQIAIAIAVCSSAA
jgi:hypothetical protein